MSSTTASRAVFASNNEQRPPKRSWLQWILMGPKFLFVHVTKHVGVGLVCAVAYFDPGNWGVDLQAGSEFGYHLLFVILLAGMFGIFLQVLCSRLGCVTGLDLASHVRLMYHDRPRNTQFWRWFVLYPLYALAEVAIISTDLAELLGSAIALCLLFPGLELWQGVLLTGLDVLLILALGDPLRGKPVKLFEWLIASMVLSVLVCIAVIIAKVQPVWSTAFEGYIPSKYIFQGDGLYTSVGILGATVMPHSLFLGSALATQDRVHHKETAKGNSKQIDLDDDKASTHTEGSGTRKSAISQWFADTKEEVLQQFRIPPPSKNSTDAVSHNARENNSQSFVKAHIYYGIVDVVSSLLGFALVINSMITILASAVFFYGNPGSSNGGPASLFDAYDLIKHLVGLPAAKLFAVALLAAGQSSSIIATVSGQAVAEGYIHWRVSPVIRRLMTRLLAIIPSTAVAVAVGKDGINTLLVASQVILSITLPFITFPLLYLTASKEVMRVRVEKPASSNNSTTITLPSSGYSGTYRGAITEAPRLNSNAPTLVEEGSNEEWEDFSNSIYSTALGMVIWLIIVAANFYVVVKLAVG
ncbi:natural resistance-associated macrophage protein [Pluteus cervinus]|uniref:Natural resistance-associated macrophage protein n=1 Tax=Pluteus cervinus TaxID=181527 RepID=A0ACD3ABD1_9AGAR|nr:natural resistance-associated macrophage protein [Pluteus cervinus]